MKEDGSFNFTEYHPSSIPGHNLPHAWLHREGKTVSTRDLVRDDKFVLITGDASKWKAFSSELIGIEIIGEGGWTPKGGAWKELCGIGSTGAIWMRPDGVVPWRAKEWKDDFETSFASIFAGILGRDRPASRL